MAFTRLFDTIYHQQAEYPNPKSISFKDGAEWKSYSTSEVIEQVNRVSRGLLGAGLQPGDTIGIITNNRPEWNFLDLGMQQIGVINVPVYTSSSLDDYRYIFADSGVKFIVVSDKALCSRIGRIRPDLPALQEIYTFDDVEGAKNWSQLLQNQAPQQQVDEIKDAISPGSLATIIYTSGTTGNPKGVMLSHQNIASNVRSCLSVLPVSPRTVGLSSLPICHIYERMVNYLFIASGSAIYYAEGVEKLGDNLREVQPTLFTTVPRLLEKLFERIMAKGKDLKPIQKKIFFWAVEIGLQYSPEKMKQPAYAAKLKLARALVFKKWKAALGGRIDHVYTGAAAMQPRLARVFIAAGINIREGFGQTEASPVIACNRFDEADNRIGTCGPVIPDVQVKIADDGEILVKGDNVMMGYYHRPDLTAETIDPDGWLHTGDIGTFVEGRFLKITDRKKELFKTSGGKYIAPQPLENKLKESEFVEQVLVVGENQKTVSALIVPSFANLSAWAEQNGLNWATHEELIELPAVKQLYAKIRNEANKSFAEHEQIRRFAIMANEWTIERGQMTPTLKLKRKIIIQQFQHIIQTLYGNDQ